jgi:hypothetical protein
MSDPLDEADHLANLFLEKALAKKKIAPEKTGFCLYCEEPTPGVFCSKECREDHERIERVKAIQGT